MLYSLSKDKCVNSEFARNKKLSEFFSKKYFLIFGILISVCLISNLVSADTNYTTGEIVFGTLADGTPEWGGTALNYGGMDFTYGTSNLVVGNIFPTINPSDFKTKLNFGAYSGSILNNILTLDGETGYVGVGTTSPLNTLNVLGDINATTSIWSQNKNLTLGYDYALNASAGGSTNWNNNYSAFLNKINWSQAVNGTLMLAANWNATNTSYYLASNPYGFYNSTNPQTETDPKWTANYSDYLITKTYASNDTNYNSSGLIKDWNATGLIKDDNATGYIKNWNASSLIINWSLQPAGIETLWNANYSNFSTIYSHTVATTNVHGLTFTSEGSGGGLDADTLDTYHATSFSRAASSQNSIISSDTRDINYNASDRNAGLYADFKANSADGLSDGGTYHGVLTFRSYGSTSDLSGGYPIQIAYTPNGNLWTRMATSNTTWGAWSKMINNDSLGGLETDPKWIANYSDYLNTKNYALNDSRWTLNYSTFLTHITWANVVNGTLYGQMINGTAILPWTNNYTNGVISQGRNLSVGYDYALNETKWGANYSAFLNKINWSQAVNGTLMLASNWNATNTSYYLASNPYGFYNSTNPQTETDPKWTGNYTAYNATWTSTYNSTYNAYNSSGLIKDWNATGLIANWSLASAAESDPYWTGNQTKYYNKTEVTANITSANTSLANYVEASYLRNDGDNGTGVYNFGGTWQTGGVTVSGGSLYAQSLYVYNITSLAVNHLDVNGSLLPQIGFNNTFDLGNSTLVWRNGYFGENVTAKQFLGNINASYVQNAPWVTAGTETDPKWTANYSDYLNTKNYALNDSRWTLNYSAFLNKINWSTAYNGTLAKTDAANTFGAFNQTFDTSTLFVDSVSNRVGIGTTAPSEKLSVISGDFGISKNSKLQLETGSTSWYLGLLDSPTGAQILTTRATVYNVYDGANQGFMIRNTANTSLFEIEGDTGKTYIKGNVGIGTTNPDVYKLKVNGAGYFDSTTAPNIYAGTYYGITGSSDTNIASFSNHNIILTPGGTGNIQLSGNVGIGTTSPNYRLTVLPASAGGGISVRESDDGTDALLLQGYAGGGALSVLAGGVAKFYVDATDKMYFTGGNVGIGTTSPGEKLDVYGNIQMSSGGLIHRSTADGSDNTNIKIGGGGGNDETRGGNIYLYGNEFSSGGYEGVVQLDAGNVANGEIRLNTGNTRRLTILNGGNVGIGTTSPGQVLHLNKTTGGTLMRYSAGNYNFNWDTGIMSDGFYLKYNETSTIMKLENTGKVGINTTTPQNTLNVLGDINATTSIWSQGKNLTLGYDYSLNASLWTTNYSAFLNKINWSQAYNGTLAKTDANNVFGAFNQTFDTNLLFLNANTNMIGIGTVEPGRKVHIAGTGLATDAMLITSGFLEVDGANSYANTSGGAENLRIGWPTSTRVGFNVEGAEVMTMLPSGNVGIGNITPNSNLVINGSNNYGALNVVNKTGTSILFVNGSTGWVGIGTTAPGYKFQVGIVDDATIDYSMLDGLRISGNDSLNTIWQSTSNKDLSLTTNGGKLLFRTAASGNINMTIDATGKVGIATTVPTQTLDVNGSMNISATASNPYLYFGKGGYMYDNGTATIIGHS